jgi:hypothetical protein
MLLEILRNPSLPTLRESRRPLDPRVPPCLHISDNRLSSSTTIAAIPIRAPCIRRVTVLIIGHFLLIVMLGNPRNIRAGFRLRRTVGVGGGSVRDTAAHAGVVGLVACETCGSSASAESTYTIAMFRVWVQGIGGVCV